MPLKRKPQVAVGVGVLALGAVLLATRFVPISSAPAWLLGLGLALALLGLVQRAFGWLVAGLPVLGLGAGLVFGDIPLGGLPKNSWTLLGLGAGFLSVVPLARMLSIRAHWWPAVVGALFAATGVLRAVRDVELITPRVEIAVRSWWPVGLVLVGAWLVMRAARAR
jgi:hypothetical protein